MKRFAGAVVAACVLLLPAVAHAGFAAGDQVVTPDGNAVVDHYVGSEVVVLMADSPAVRHYPESKVQAPAPPPPPDADGDGVADSVDQCPNDPGPASNNGCPLPPPDTTAPDTTITTGPVDGTATDATVAFTASEAGSSFECKLDAGAWSSCLSPKQYTGLAVGSHTISVRATDLAGNTDQSPATVTWAVQAPTPPPASSFPDASNTGVPAGTSLTAYTGPSNVTTANTVISGKTIGCIQISAPGVVIKNSRISCAGSAVMSEDGTWTGTPLTIQDSEIDCKNSNGTAVAEANFTVLRVNIHGCENGFDINQNVLIQDSYIHDLYNSSQAHTDGAQLAWGHVENGKIVAAARNVTFRHNTIYGMGADGSFGTSAIISNRGGDQNILIENNLLAGGAYTLYCEQGATGSNYRVYDNHFSTRFKSTVGYYGRSTDCSDETQSGNVIHETGQLITLG